MICEICEDNRAQTNWRGIGRICNECDEILEKYAPYVQGKYKLDNETAFKFMKKAVHEHNTVILRPPPIADYIEIIEPDSE